jgi:HSP20 family protein
MLASLPRVVCSFSNTTFNLSPCVDIFSGKGGLQIQLKLPGVRKEEIPVEADSLSVTAEKMPMKLEGAKRIHAEREFGFATRMFKLPSNAQVGKLEAVLTNGVLTVSVPMNKEREIERKVQ